MPFLVSMPVVCSRDASECTSSPTPISSHSMCHPAADSLQSGMHSLRWAERWLVLGCVPTLPLPGGIAEQSWPLPRPNLEAMQGTTACFVLSRVKGWVSEKAIAL